MSDTLTNPTKSHDDIVLTNMIDLRKTTSDILSLLLGSKQNSAIDEALLRILQFFDVDRAYIGIFDKQSLTVDFTNEVTFGGVISMREDLLRELSREEIPWWIDNIEEGKDIIIRDVSLMPKEAAHEQHLLILQEVRSLLVIPMFKKGEPFGFIGLDSVKRQRNWTALDVENMRMLADILSIAIDRKDLLGQMEQTVEQVMKSETKFQMIFDKMPYGAELYDENGLLIDINQADLNIFGVTREQVLGIDLFKNPNIPSYVNDQLKAGKDITFTLDYNFDAVSKAKYYNSGKTSTRHLVVKGVTFKDSSERIFGYLYMVFDDTENYIKREEVQDALARLKLSVDTGDSLLWEYDVNNDRITLDFGLNTNTTHNEGIAAIQHAGLSNLQEFCATLHPEDFDRVYNRQFKPLLSGKINHFVSAYRRVLQGKTFWFNTNIRAYKLNEDGTPGRVLCYSTDITRQREKELELIKVKEADKLKSAFLANMSHEIRTPLNAIVGFSNIISEVTNVDEREQFLNIINKNNDLLLQLIDDILDFSKIEAGTLDYHMEDIDIKTVCAEVVLSDSIKLSKDVKLVFDSSSPSVIVHTDEKRVKQVLFNFVNNAIKFTQQGSITLYYYNEKGFLWICVKDTGVGITPENQRRIFERFIKVDSFQQGTGLGLTISRTIIETLGGSIGVDSEVGKGSTFWFTLPLKRNK